MTCLDRMKFVPDPEGGPDILTVWGPTVTPQPIPFGPPRKLLRRCEKPAKMNL